MKVNNFLKFSGLGLNRFDINFCSAQKVQFIYIRIMSKKLEDEPLFLEKSVRSVGVIVTTKFQELIYS